MRAILGRLLLMAPDLLLLDEPTNHLDMFSASVLAESLNEYAGSLLFVSHDRTFISRVANKIWWIENGVIREYPGTYDEYNDWIRTRTPEAATLKPAQKVAADNVPAEKIGKSASKGVSKNKIQEWERQMESLEAEIKSMDSELATLTLKMQDGDVAGNSEVLLDLVEAHRKLQLDRDARQAALDGVMELWVDAQ